MVAKKQPRADLQAILSLHLEARRHREGLLAEARALHAAGKLKEARVVLKTAKFVQAHMRALEVEFRRPRARSKTNSAH